LPDVCEFVRLSSPYLNRRCVIRKRKQRQDVCRNGTDTTRDFRIQKFTCEKPGTKIAVKMIPLTRLNGQPLIINSDLIKVIENAPDTVISLVNGEKIVVRESGEVILDRIVQFRRRVLDGLQTNLCCGNPLGSTATSSAKANQAPSEEP